MNKVKIITDSTCDLGSEILKELDVDSVALYVNFGEETYLDGQNITTEDLYRLVEEKGELPKTAAVSIATLMDVFQKWVDLGYDVVYTGIGRRLSRTYENAVMAADEVSSDRVFVVDSMNLSTGIGLQVFKACKYRDEGLDAKTIAEKLENDRKNVRAQFAIETMDYLYKGGRCSGMAKIFGTFLKIKPIIAVIEGKLEVVNKPRGKMKVALDWQIEQLVNDLPKLDLDRVIVTHSLGFEYNDYVVARLKEIIPNVPIVSTVAGCVISSHCGRGTIGVLYMVTE